MDVASGSRPDAAVRPGADPGAPASAGRTPAVGGGWERFRCAGATSALDAIEALLDALCERLGADLAAVGVDPPGRGLLPRPLGSGATPWLATSPRGSSTATGAATHRMIHPVHLADGRIGELLVQRAARTFGRDEHQLAGAAAMRLAVLVERAEHEATRARSASESLRTPESRKLETLGGLVRGVAHDVNNLLQVILGSVQLLADHSGDEPPLRQAAERATEAIDLATALSRQLVDFARARAGAAEPVNPDAIVQGVDRLLATLLGDRCTLRLRLAAADELVLADPAALAQVVLNLVLNARDAMPDGGTVEIRSGTVTFDGRPGVVLTVRDEGVGMDAEVRARIFEPLFTTKPPHRGSGLGLSTVERIVRELGGRIRVDSEPGVGSTFEVLLPVAAIARADPA